MVGEGMARNFIFTISKASSQLKLMVQGKTFTWGRSTSFFPSGCAVFPRKCKSVKTVSAFCFLRPATPKRGL